MLNQIDEQITRLNERINELESELTSKRTELTSLEQARELLVNVNFETPDPGSMASPIIERPSGLPLSSHLDRPLSPGEIVTGLVVYLMAYQVSRDATTKHEAFPVNPEGTARPYIVCGKDDDKVLLMGMSGQQRNGNIRIKHHLLRGPWTDRNDAYAVPGFRYTMDTKTLLDQASRSMKGDQRKYVEAGFVEDELRPWF